MRKEDLLLRTPHVFRPIWLPVASPVKASRPGCDVFSALFPRRRSIPFPPKVVRICANWRRRDSPRAPRPLWIAQSLLPEIQRPFQFARAQGEEEAIQLRYTVEQYDIRLWAEPSAANRWYLIGQVFSQAENAFVSAEEALLHSDDGAALKAQPEDTEFHFPAVVSGAYRLEIRLPESYLLAPEVILA